MANDLLDVVAESYPINLDDMVEELPKPQSKIPEASVRNQAALTTLLSDDPAKIEENYRNMMVEAEQGTSYTKDAIKNQADARHSVGNKQALMSILSDPKIPLEQKRQAILNINSDFNKDTSTIVASAAAQLPSKGENQEQEDVRILGAEQFKSVRESRELKQKLLNGKMAKLNPAFGSMTADVAEVMIAPFAVNKVGFGILNDILTELGGTASRKRTAATPGSTIMDIREKLAQIPAEDRIAVEQKIADMIYNTPNIVFQNDNAFARMTLSSSILQEGGYSSVDKWLDNASGLLDIIGVGTLAKSGIRQVTKLFTKTPQNVVDNINLRSVTNTTSPVSPIKVMEDSNPERARGMYEMIVKSSGDEVAQAVASTSKDAAIVDAHLPQPLARDGSIESKLVDPDRNVKTISPDEKVVKEWEDSGALIFTENERKAAQAVVFHDLVNVKNITPLDNMTAIGVNQGNTLSIKAVYGTTEGGFLKAQDALDQVKLSLREYSITDRDLTLMRKEGDEYIPVTLAEAKADGNYVVQLDTKHKLSANDITEWDKLDVKRNFFDRIPFLRSSKSGTVANHILDNASMLHPTISGAMVVQTDKAVRIDKLLLKLHAQFSDAYTKLPKARQDKVYEYLKEANANGLELNANQLVGRGFVQDEIQAIQQWRKNWDTHYWLENADLVRTLTHQGFKVFDSNNTKLFAKEIGKNQNIGKVYDPSVDAIVPISKTDMDALYQAGGSLAVFRRPLDVNGTVIEHMMVRNTPTEYLRGLRDFDQVLDYRKGYYQVQYKAPKFITERLVNSAGTEYYKAREVAGDTQSAEQIRRRLAVAENKPVEDFRVRDDLKDMKVDTDAYWDLHNASGRISQRRRGKRLEDSSAPVGGFDHQYMLDPVESAIRASRSLSGRVAMRDALEVSKQRALAQYGDFFKSDGKGGKQWVEHSNSLVPTTARQASELADARTTVEYINYMQNGYVNAFDESFKSTMNAVASMLTASPKAEKSFIWMGGINPTNEAKHGVFQAYIGLNPFRQALIQSHQTVRLLGYNPAYLASGKASIDGMTYNLYTVMKRDINLASKADKEMIEFIQKSGMLDAVDKQNLVRGTLYDMKESSNKVKKIAGTMLTIPRKIGFDSGEQANLALHLLAVRDKFIKQGKNMADPAVRDEAYSVARALTYDMNFAGDLPYNQNAFSLFLQFFQVPHKAFLSLTNRRIPASDRVRLAMMDTLLFGVPGALAIENLIGKEMLPKDGPQRDAVTHGLVSTAYNGALSVIAGKDIKVDFSSLSPYGIDGFAHLVHAVTSGGMLEFIQNSPAFTMYIKSGSRVQESFGRMFRYLGFIDTQEGLDPETATSVLKGVAEISSGWTNAQKAKIIYEMGKIPDKKENGAIMDDAHWMYAAAQVLGFRSQKEVFEWAAIKELQQNDKDREADYKKVYDSYIRVLTRDNKLKVSDPEAIEKVLGAVRLIYKDDFKAQEWFHKRLAKDMVDKKDTLMRNVIEAGNFYDANKSMANARQLGIVDEDYKKALKLFEDLQQAQQKLKESD